MRFEDAALYVNTWGLVALVVMFAVVVGYALWPSNKDAFDRAARLPLEEEPFDGKKRH